MPVNVSAIESGRIEKTSPHAVKHYLPDYMGLLFEKMFQDYLLYYSESLPIELREIGQWWGTDPKKKKQIQIDIVGTLVKGRDYIIGSCKYRNEKIGVDRLLQAQERGEVQLITLEDLYK